MPLEDSYTNIRPTTQEEIEQYNQIGNRFYTENVSDDVPELEDPNQEGGLTRYSLSDAAAYTPSPVFNDYGDKGRTTYFSTDIAGNEISRFQTYGDEIYGNFGFNPYRDNNDFYNSHTSDWVDYGRAWDGMWKLAGVGLKDTYVFGLFGEKDNYKTFGQIMSDYSSTRKQFDKESGEWESTWTSFFSNTMLSSGYTLGIVGGVIAEELTLFGMGKGLRLFRGGAAVTNPLGAWKAGRHIARQADKVGYHINAFRYLRNLDGAKTFLGKSAQWVGRGIGKTAHALAPAGNTMDFLRGIDDIKFAQMSNAERLFHGAASLARDARKFYLAHSESKLEANFVQDEIVTGLIQQWQMEHPGEAMPEKVYNDIIKRGEVAYEKSYSSNYGLIYITNGLFLEGALKGFKPSALSLGTNFERVGVGTSFEFIQATQKSIGKYISNKWQSVTPFKLKNWTSYPGGAARMSMEGVQEVGQDIIHKASMRYGGVDKDEETGLFTLNHYNPEDNEWYQGLGNYYENLKESLDASTWETFFTGLLIGPFVAPVNVASQVVRDVRAGELGAVFKSQKESVQKDYEERQQAAIILTEYFDRMKEDAEFVKHIKGQSSLRLTKKAIGEMMKAAREENHKEFLDRQGDLFRYGTELVLKYGLENELIEHLESLKDHTVNELNETANRTDITEENKEEFLKEMDGYIKRFKNLRYEQTKIKRLNINKSAFYLNHSDPVKNLLATHSYLAEEDYIAELLWNADKIEEVKQRLERTISALTENNLLSREALSALLDTESAKEKINILKEELQNAEQYDVLSKTELQKKQIELDALVAYNEVLQKIEKAREEGKSIESLKEELKTHFIDYTNAVGNRPVEYDYYNAPQHIDLSSKFNTLFDTLSLQDDLAYFIESAKVAIDPKFKTQFIEQHLNLYKTLDANKQAYLERALEAHYEKWASDLILNEMLKEGMFFGNTHQLADLLQKGIMPTDIYYIATKEPVSKEDYAKVVKIAEKVYKKLTGKSLEKAGAEPMSLLQRSRKRRKNDKRSSKSILRQYRGNKKKNKPQTLEELLSKLLEKPHLLSYSDIELIQKLDELIKTGTIDAKTQIIITNEAVTISLQDVEAMSKEQIDKEIKKAKTVHEKKLKEAKEEKNTDEIKKQEALLELLENDVVEYFIQQAYEDVANENIDKILKGLGVEEKVYGNKAIDIMDNGTLIVDARYASEDYAVNIPEEKINEAVERQINQYKLNNPNYTEEDLEDVSEAIKSTLGDQTVAFEYLLLSGIITQQLAKNLSTNKALLNTIINFMDIAAKYVANKQNVNVIALQNAHPEFNDPVAFLREALTNFEFQVLLQQIEYTVDDEYSSVWSNFNNAISSDIQEAFKLTPNKTRVKNTLLDHALGLAQLQLNRELVERESSEVVVSDEPAIGTTEEVTEEEVVEEAPTVEEVAEETPEEKINRLKNKKKELQQKKRNLKVKRLSIAPVLDPIYRRRSKIQIQEENTQKEIEAIDAEIKNISEQPIESISPFSNIEPVIPQEYLDGNGNLVLNANTPLNLMPKELQFQLMMAYIGSNFANVLKHETYKKFRLLNQDYSEEKYNELKEAIGDKELGFIQDVLSKPTFNNIINVWRANNNKQEPLEVTTEEAPKPEVTTEEAPVVEEVSEDTTILFLDKRNILLDDLTVENFKMFFEGIIDVNAEMKNLYKDEDIKELVELIKESENPSVTLHDIETNILTDYQKSINIIKPETTTEQPTDQPQASPTTTTKADIERRRQEELKDSGRSRLLQAANNAKIDRDTDPNSPFKEMTDEEIDAEFQKGFDSLNDLLRLLRKNGVSNKKIIKTIVNKINNHPILRMYKGGSKQFTQSIEKGLDSFLPSKEVNAKYDAELAALEEPSVTKPQAGAIISINNLTNSNVTGSIKGIVTERKNEEGNYYEAGKNLKEGDILSIVIVRPKKGKQYITYPGSNKKYEAEISILNSNGERIGSVEYKSSAYEAIMNSNNPDVTLLKLEQIFYDGNNEFSGGKFTIYVDAKSAETLSKEEQELKSLLNKFKWEAKVAGQLELFNADQDVFNENKKRIIELVQQLGNRGMQIYNEALDERASKEKNPADFKVLFDIMSDVKTTAPTVQPTTAEIKSINEDVKLFTNVDNILKHGLSETNTSVLDFIKIYQSTDKLTQKQVEALNKFVDNASKNGLLQSILQELQGKSIRILQGKETGYKILGNQNNKIYFQANEKMYVTTAYTTTTGSLTVREFLKNFIELITEEEVIKTSTIDVGVEEEDVEDIKISLSIFTDLNNRLDDFTPQKVNDEELTKNIIEQLNKC